MLAAQAAGNAPLAGNVISTFSYQLANTKDPQRAGVLARTAYAGARRDATATTRALLLERIAWADAKSGDLSGCEQALGEVEEAFSNSKPEDDPDWVYWLNQEEIDVMAGRCYTGMKRPKRAVVLLDDAMGKVQPRARARELPLPELACRRLIQLGEIDHAASVAKELLRLQPGPTQPGPTDRLQHLAPIAQTLRRRPGRGRVPESPPGDSRLGPEVPDRPVRTFCTVSRRPAGPLAPPTRRARRSSRWRSRYGGANAGRLARRTQTPGRH